jgi:hypothetical protein
MHTAVLLFEICHEIHSAKIGNAEPTTARPQMPFTDAIFCTYPARETQNTAILETLHFIPNAV